MKILFTIFQWIWCDDKWERPPRIVAAMFILFLVILSIILWAEFAMHEKMYFDYCQDPNEVKTFYENNSTLSCFVKLNHLNFLAVAEALGAPVKKGNGGKT